MFHLALFIIGGSKVGNTHVAINTSKCRFTTLKDIFLQRTFVYEGKHHSAMTMEIFKTNVGDEVAANDLIILLLQHFPASRINFDLHDCDKVLRIEGPDFTTGKVMLLAKEKGITCTVLN